MSFEDWFKIVEDAEKRGGFSSRDNGRNWTKGKCPISTLYGIPEYQKASKKSWALQNAFDHALQTDNFKKAKNILRRMKYNYDAEMGQ